jgi:hypothetical protein
MVWMEDFQIEVSTEDAGGSRTGVDDHFKRTRLVGY